MCQVDGKEGIVPQRGRVEHSVDLTHGSNLLVVCPKDGVEALSQDIGIHRVGKGALCNVGQPGKGRVEITISTIITPQREENLANACFAAGIDACSGIRLRQVVIVPQLAPGPHAGRHQRLVAQCSMALYPVQVETLVGMVIVPVNKLGLRGNGRSHVLRNLAI